MLRKKICMVGAPGVGKTSLVRRFVESIFSDRYHATLGVKVDKKVVRVGGVDVSLVLWDLAGMERLSDVPSSYLNGASGYLLVADGTRPWTIETALALEQGIGEAIGDVPHVLLLNKSDLVDEWAPGPAPPGLTALETSAKTGSQVEEAFHELAARLLAA